MSQGKQISASRLNGRDTDHFLRDSISDGNGSRQHAVESSRSKKKSSLHRQMRRGQHFHVLGVEIQIYKKDLRKYLQRPAGCALLHPGQGPTNFIATQCKNNEHIGHAPSHCCRIISSGGTYLSMERTTRHVSTNFRYRSYVSTQ